MGECLRQRTDESADGVTVEFVLAAEVIDHVRTGLFRCRVPVVVHQLRNPFPSLACDGDDGRPASATVCYVKEITHREMRNNSAEVLRRVASGETLLVTNNGQPAAVISPPSGDLLSILEAQGQLRVALNSPASLRSIKRKRSTKTTAEIISDVRGKW